MASNSKTSSFGLPKLTYDHVKQRSNLLEVEKALNFYVQQNFTTLHDCISLRSLRIINIPSPPMVVSPAIRQQLESSSLAAAATTTARSTRSTSKTSGDDHETELPQAPPQAPLPPPPPLSMDFELANYTERIPKKSIKKRG